ncbi:BglG family transcription antiterminator [Enterococcus termitis]|uniref:Transcriptional antiterminator n=1 Tax=Enterococcus termitis TaxID=332950 RepID=A0A1E5GHQ6_9ENTE|nr:BglG family transcription antiterminator [Enterococcus termitis]OEG12256.1 transcriptional antiterminator [Enterococcus termitis]OJG98931.1 PRD domain protein [Enterococcus termitis]
MVLERREQEILNLLLKNELMTISQIAEALHLSNKTISQSLKNIDHYFEGSSVSLIRKPKVGISLMGNLEEIKKQMRSSVKQTIPTSKEERVQYLCFEILKKSGYFTRQDLQETLYIGKTTLEKDMMKVSEIFSLFHVTIEWIPGKGSFLNLMEQEKRKLAVDLIYYFWGQNWQVVKTEHSFVHTIDGIPDFASDVVNLDLLKQIDEIVQRYLSNRQQKLSDMSYHSLLLHLLIAVERIKEGKFIEKAPIEKEFVLTQDIHLLVRELEQSFAIDLPLSEIQFIQIHLSLDEQTTIRPVKDAMNDDLIRKSIKETITAYDEAALIGLVAHIKAVIERIRYGLPVVNPFLLDVKQSFPISFEEAIQLKQQLEKVFTLVIPEDEVAYLAVHIQAFKEREKEENTYKTKVLLVCSSGKGTSQLLAARLRRTFPKIDISRILSIQELANTKVTEDLVLSTVNLTMKNQPIVYVSPVLSLADQQKINRFLKEHEATAVRTKEFSQLIHSELIFLEQSLPTVKAVIRFIGEQLSLKGYAKKAIIQSAIERETLSFTSFGKFATPHGSPEQVLKSAIVFVRLKEEIKWGNEKVKYIFFICIKDETPEELELVYDNLLEIIDNGDRGYLAKGNKKQLLSYLKEGS